MGLREVLGDGPIAVDTALFIYFIEESRDYVDLVLPIFSAASNGQRQIVTSAVALLEVMIVPYRSGNLHLAEKYEAILTRSRGVELVKISEAQLRAGAQLRALFGIRTPDALQLAAGLSRGCTAFVTNDRRLPSIPGLPIVQLSELGSPAPLNAS